MCGVIKIYNHFGELFNRVFIKTEQLYTLQNCNSNSSDAPNKLQLWQNNLLLFKYSFLPPWPPWEDFISFLHHCWLKYGTCVTSLWIECTWTKAIFPTSWLALDNGINGHVSRGLKSASIIGLDHLHICFPQWEGDESVRCWYKLEDSYMALCQYFVPSPT